MGDYKVPAIAGIQVNSKQNLMATFTDGSTILLDQAEKKMLLAHQGLGSSPILQNEWMQGLDSNLMVSLTAKSLILWEQDFNTQFWKHAIVELPEESVCFEIAHKIITVSFASGQIQDFDLHSRTLQPVTQILGKKHGLALKSLSVNEKQVLCVEQDGGCFVAMHDSVADRFKVVAQLYEAYHKNEDGFATAVLAQQKALWH